LCLFACLAVVPREGGCSFVVKKNWRFKFGEARQRFRLTPTEIRVAAFVVAAFALGLITKCYRDAHQSPSLPQPNKTRTKFASPAPASTPARKRTGKARKQSPQSSSVAHVPETFGVGETKSFSATFFRATLRRLSVKATIGQNETHNQIPKNG